MVALNVLFVVAVGNLIPAFARENECAGGASCADVSTQSDDNALLQTQLAGPKPEPTGKCEPTPTAGYKLNASDQHCLLYSGMGAWGHNYPLWLHNKITTLEECAEMTISDYNCKGDIFISNAGTKAGGDAPICMCVKDGTYYRPTDTKKVGDVIECEPQPNGRDYPYRTSIFEICDPSTAPSPGKQGHKGTKSCRNFCTKNAAKLPEMCQKQVCASCDECKKIDWGCPKFCTKDPSQAMFRRSLADRCSQRACAGCDICKNPQPEPVPEMCEDGYRLQRKGHHCKFHQGGMGRWGFNVPLWLQSQYSGKITTVADCAEITRQDPSCTGSIFVTNAGSDKVDDGKPICMCERKGFHDGIPIECELERNGQDYPFGTSVYETCSAGGYY